MSHTVNWNAQCVRKENVFNLNLMRWHSISQVKFFALLCFCFRCSAEKKQQFSIKRFVQYVWGKEIREYCCHLNLKRSEMYGKWIQLFNLYSLRFAFSFSHFSQSHFFFFYEFSIIKFILSMNKNTKLFAQHCALFTFKWMALLSCSVEVGWLVEFFLI